MLMACCFCFGCSCRIAERLEWWVSYLLCADDNGIISKEKVRKLYDGSIFYEIANELEQKKAARAGTSKAKWT
jgi:peroxygenase